MFDSLPRGLAAGMALLLACAGCGGPPSTRAAVRGQVTLNGEPLAEGRIVFEPAAGNSGPSAGGSIVQGSYHIEQDRGPTLGKNIVRINASRATGRQVPSITPGETIAETVEAIPEVYNRQSTLERDVQPGTNELNFELDAR